MNARPPCSGASSRDKTTLESRIPGSEKVSTIRRQWERELCQWGKAQRHCQATIATAFANPRTAGRGRPLQADTLAAPCPQHRSHGHCDTTAVAAAAAAATAAAAGPKAGDVVYAAVARESADQMERHQGVVREHDVAENRAASPAAGHVSAEQSPAAAATAVAAAVRNPAAAAASTGVSAAAAAAAEQALVAAAVVAAAAAGPVAQVLEPSAAALQTHPAMLEAAYAAELVHHACCR